MSAPTGSVSPLGGNLHLLAHSSDIVATPPTTPGHLRPAVSRLPRPHSRVAQRVNRGSLPRGLQRILGARALTSRLSAPANDWRSEFEHCLADCRDRETRGYS